MVKAAKDAHAGRVQWCSSSVVRWLSAAGQTRPTMRSPLNSPTTARLAASISLSFAVEPRRPRRAGCRPAGSCRRGRSGRAACRSSRAAASSVTTAAASRSASAQALGAQVHDGRRARERRAVDVRRSHSRARDHELVAASAQSAANGPQRPSAPMVWCGAARRRAARRWRGRSHRPRPCAPASGRLLA